VWVASFTTCRCTRRRLVTQLCTLHSRARRQRYGTSRHVRRDGLYRSVSGRSRRTRRGRVPRCGCLVLASEGVTVVGIPGMPKDIGEKIETFLALLKSIDSKLDTLIELERAKP
jgi:hypothetical protein